MILGPLVRRALHILRCFYRRPVRVVGTLALFAMPAACAFCVETVISPQAQEHTAFCAQYVTENKLVEAEQRGKLAIEYAPKYAEPYNCLGLVAYHRGQHDLAIDYFKRAISLKNDFAEAHNNLGALFTEQREHGMAEDQFREALEIDPGYVSARYNLAMSLMTQGESGEAQEHFLRCLELDPNSCDCRMGMGVLAIGRKEWDDARAHFQRLTEICPQDANGFYNLGWSYFQLGRCHEAYSAFIDTLALKPDHLEARKNVTVAMDCLGKQDSAVQRWMDKIRDNPGDPDLHFKLGALFEDRQQYDLARYEFLSTLKLDPKYELAYFRVARLFDRNLQTQETIEFCQKFVDLLRDEAHAREKEWCIGRVKELQFR